MDFLLYIAFIDNSNITLNNLNNSKRHLNNSGDKKNDQEFSWGYGRKWQRLTCPIRLILKSLKESNSQIMSWNLKINSIRNKFSIICENKVFDVIAIAETKLDESLFVL